MLQKVVLITGSTGGLGSHLAASLSQKGYRLALHYHSHTDKAGKLVRELGNNVKTYEADLRAEEEVNAMVEKVAADFGRIDIVINNAGVSFSGMSWKQDLSDWNEVLGVNTTGPFLVSKAAVPWLRKQQSGRIIHISSIVAQRPLAGTSAYAASKAALEGLMKAQAVELARFGITVNCIAPGYFDTGMIHTVDQNTKEKLIAEIPLHRLGRPEELAECVVYLASEGAAYLTGQVIQLNGGLYL